MKALKEKGTPGGFALGNATGDGNTWTHWLVWSHGGKLVNDRNQVVIDSPETVKALEYVKELYGTFVPGTLSWLDPNNNKAFLDGQVSITANGISVYFAAKNSADPKIKEMTADINHSNFPIGPVGRPTEFNLFFNQMIFKYTKYPRAAKEFLRFMMEEEQVSPWLTASIGYVTPALTAYEKHPVWSDPKSVPYRDSMKIMLPSGYSGKMGYASAGALADFIIVNMVAEAASGSKTPKEAAERAQKRAERYYKV
jgi:multiple sugar transport system substrate-binding protein